MRSSMTMALAGLIVAGAMAGDRPAAAAKHDMRMLNKCTSKQRFQKLFETVGQ